jgi:hypothetical protein
MMVLWVGMSTVFILYFLLGSLSLSSPRSLRIWSISCSWESFCVPTHLQVSIYVFVVAFKMKTTIILKETLEKAINFHIKVLSSIFKTAGRVFDNHQGMDAWDQCCIGLTSRPPSKSIVTYYRSETTKGAKQIKTTNGESHKTCNNSNIKTYEYGLNVQ